MVFGECRSHSSCCPPLDSNGASSSVEILTNFSDQEEKVFNSLYTLIDDARSLRIYAATALHHIQVRG